MLTMLAGIAISDCPSSQALSRVGKATSSEVSKAWSCFVNKGFIRTRSHRLLLGPCQIELLEFLQ